MCVCVCVCVCVLESEREKESERKRESEREQERERERERAYPVTVDTFHCGHPPLALHKSNREITPGGIPEDYRMGSTLESSFVICSMLKSSLVTCLMGLSSDKRLRSTAPTPHFHIGLTGPFRFPTRVGGGGSEFRV